MLREIPLKMKKAISDNLSPPTEIAAMPTMLFGCDTAYVDFYCPVFDKNGERTWERCEANSCLRFDHDGVPWFGIGIYIEKTPGVLTTSTSMMRFLFYIEEFDAQSVELRIKNLAGTIPIKNAHDPANYGEAAKLAESVYFVERPEEPNKAGRCVSRTRLALPISGAQRSELHLLPAGPRKSHKPAFCEIARRSLRIRLLRRCVEFLQECVGFRESDSFPYGRARARRAASSRRLRPLSLDEPEAATYLRRAPLGEPSHARDGLFRQAFRRGPCPPAVQARAAYMRNISGAALLARRHHPYPGRSVDAAHERRR